MASQIIDPKQLKRVRKELGVTQSRLASEAGVSQSLIAKIEAEHIDPTFISMKLISEALRSRRSMKGKKASEIMSTPVVSVRANQRLSECITTMKKHGISQMPVLEGVRQVGSITESHILKLISEAADPKRVVSQPVKRLMQPPFPVIGGDTPVEALLSLFNYVPVVLISSADEIEGVIAKIDLLAAQAAG